MSDSRKSQLEDIRELPMQPSPETWRPQREERVWESLWSQWHTCWSQGSARLAGTQGARSREKAGAAILCTWGSSRKPVPHSWGKREKMLRSQAPSLGDFGLKQWSFMGLNWSLRGRWILVLGFNWNLGGYPRRQENKRNMEPHKTASTSK